ncbi:MAG: Crp/Fnr family transcriptional regulator [Phycisphaerae bacterium]|nr:Crp/Fnr family transcriptional regulator [Saprospiraceae bacterium]
MPLSFVQKITEPFLFKHHVVLENLPESILVRIHERFKPRTFSDGEVLFRQGNYAKGACFLRSGLVKIAQSTPQGQRQIIYVYTVGDLVGYRHLLSSEAYSMEATAVGRVDVDFIPAELFVQLVREEPLFAHNLLIALSQEFSVWVNRMTFFLRYPVRTRLAICLLTLYKQYAVAGHQPPAIVFSRTDLADFVGATLETTVRTLSEFRDKGWLESKGRRILLTAPEELANAAGSI